MKRFKELKEALKVVAVDNRGKNISTDEINKLQGAVMKRDKEGTRNDESVEHLDEFGSASLSGGEIDSGLNSSTPYKSKTKEKKVTQESEDLDEGHAQIKQHLEQELANKDINAMVHMDRVHVHPDNTKKARDIVRKLGYSHQVVGTLKDSSELEGEQLDERGLDVGHNQQMVKKNFDKYVQAVRAGKYKTASRVSRKYFKNKTKLISAGKTPVK